MSHYKQEWEDLGRNIQNVVDRAVNSQDYQVLNQSIRQVVEQAVDLGGEAVRKAAGAVSSSRGVAYQPQPPKKLYGSTFGKQILNILKLIGGGIFSLLGFFGVLGGFFVNEPILFWFTLGVVFLGMFAGGLVLCCNGLSSILLVDRFIIYRRTLGNTTQCALAKLARIAGKSEEYVRKDLRKMIRKGFFLEGHMNKEETYLITSNETYYLFEESRRALEERQRQEAAVKKQEPTVRADSHVQDILERGNAFVAQIRKCNDDIPGEEISRKISRMEMIVQKIFQRLESDPDIAPDLKKLMDYYLPMTVKLLNAYADMDAQPIQGENIQASKREIESTLDTLNQAYEKILDSIFLETAMDVSSDISVLNTMLAQEGLTENEFDKIKKQRNY